tara:strand:- start:44711 stop:46624 length:1914 start_codon:yes stop_codon:yes gene_type:complete
MPLQIIKLKPGIVKDISQYASGKNGPFFIDGNLVRFTNGYAEKIGGWEKEIYYGVGADGAADTNTPITVQGTPKAIVSWRANSDGEDRIALGTSSHLYIFLNSVAYDITPLRKTTSNLTNPLATTDGSTTITCTDNGHGSSNGDYIVIAEAAAVGGVVANTLNRAAGFEISNVTTNTFDITVPDAATSTVAAGGGTSIDFKYLIGNSGGLGAQSATPALGWGVGTWGQGTWNTPRSAASTGIGTSLDATQWNLNLWGEDLIANARNGQVYYWELSDGEANRAVLASTESGSSDIPTKTRVTSISFPDRHFIIGGATNVGGTNFDPMLIRFSDQENFVNFTPTSTNTAGDQRLEIGTKIIQMLPTKDETFIQTDEAAYAMTFVGPPFTFSFRLLAVNCGGVAINGAANVDGDIYWIGKDNFFIYNGNVAELPCSVQYFVFDRLQKDFVDKTFAGHNKKFNEVTWFYVSTDNSAGTNNPEPDSYVTFNYAEGSWTIGTLDRNVWEDAKGFRKVPFAFDSTGELYNHETGTTDDGSAMSCFVETSDLEVSQSGDRLFMIDKVIPDATMTSDTTLSVELKTRKYPQDTETTKGPFTITQTTGKVSTRARGRQVAVKFSSSGTTDDWQLGDFRLNTRDDSFR